VTVIVWRSAKGTIIKAITSGQQTVALAFAAVPEVVGRNARAARAPAIAAAAELGTGWRLGPITRRGANR
jgi:hypothetical protein